MQTRVLTRLWLLAILLAGCRTAAIVTPTPPPPTGNSGAGPSHIFLIVMENQEYDQLIGNPQAPYLNQLAHQYTVVDDYYAVTHPSLPNYLALLGGNTFGIRSNCTDCFIDQPNLVDELEAKGKRWKSYQEDLPKPCFLGSQADDYVLWHDPFLYFQDIRTHPSRCHQVVPLTQLSVDLQRGELPDFVWITPNLIHDMHKGSVTDGDRWLAAFIPPILSSAAWQQNGLLVITWDEGESNSGCCDLAAGGHVPLLALTPQHKGGSQIMDPATHYHLLRTIEDLWKLDHLAQSADQAVGPLPGMFLP
jgi:acid phosphatase